MGKFGVFSFHGSKTMTTGEGGMFVTQDAALFEKVLTLSNSGRASNATKQFWPDMMGYKFKMSNISAAIGCAQMERIEDLISRKREILAYYREHLESLPGVCVNPEQEGTVNGAWMPTAVFDSETGVTREKLQKAFAAENIDARVFFYPLSGLPIYGDNPKNHFAWDIPARAINLPSYHDITPAEQDRVQDVIKCVLADSRGAA
jgi:perosamine synthetase